MQTIQFLLELIGIKPGKQLQPVRVRNARVTDPSEIMRSRRK